MSAGDVGRTSATANEPAPTLPGFWKITWMFWMQPILLHQTLRQCGIDIPNERFLSLWRREGEHQPTRRRYARQLAAMQFLLMPAITFVTAGAFDLVGIPIDFSGVAAGVAMGVATGVAFGVAVGAPFGVAAGMAAGVGAAVAGVAGAISVGVVVGVAGGVASGVAFGVAPSVAAGEAPSVAHGVAFGMAIGVAAIVGGGVAAGLRDGMAGVVEGGAAAGVLASVAFIPTFFRVPVWLLEVVFWTVCRTRGVTDRWFMPPQYAPVLFHDLSYLRLPGLRSQMLADSVDPHLLRRVLDACRRSPGQRKTGETVLGVLKARELRQLLERRDFSSVAELRGEWLAGLDELDLRLRTVAEVARFLQAADLAVAARPRLQQIERAQRALWGTRNQPLNERARPADDEYVLLFRTAESIADEMRRQAEAQALTQLPNPFRAGDPLLPEVGNETFRGREEVVHQIEVLLNDDRQSAAVAVLAPRRCGKSSLLRMLPVKLPDALCVFFDLQDNPVATPLDLFPALARRTIEEARRQRRDSLPRLSDNSLESAREWLDALDQRPGDERVLLCLDEFERLEEVVEEKPETRQQLVQVMGLLRATIQHRRRVRLLVAGSATFEELGPLWNDTFISAQEVRLGPLERDVAVDLLRQPIPVSEGFPDDAVPREVAEAIVERTGGQPYLTQLYGFWLVEELNRQKRRRAELSDVEKLDDIVCDKAGAFFREAVQPRGAKFDVRAVIEQIVAGQTPELTPAETRFLVRRGLITPEGALAFPILRRWLTEFAE